MGKIWSKFNFKLWDFNQKMGSYKENFGHYVLIYENSPHFPPFNAFWGNLKIWSKISKVEPPPHKKSWLRPNRGSTRRFVQQKS